MGTVRVRGVETGTDNRRGRKQVETDDGGLTFLDG